MAITKTFLDAVKNNSISEVRIMMKDSLLTDTSFSEFNEMERRASGMTGLYVDYDGRSLITDSNQWTTDYLDLIMVQLISNFCHERIEHIKKVIKYLYPARTTSNSSSTNSNDTNNTHRANSTRTNNSFGNNSSSNNTKRQGTYTYHELKRRDAEDGRVKMVRLGIGAGVGAIVGGIVASEVLPGMIVGGAIGVLGACFINRKLENE